MEISFAIENLPVLHPERGWEEWKKHVSEKVKRHNKIHF